MVVYEGAMCCSTGVCGPEPDRELIEFSETLKRLQGEYKDELAITRASLSFNVPLFIANKEVANLLRAKGVASLPLMTIDGEIVSKQKYLSYVELKEKIEGRTKVLQ